MLKRNPKDFSGDQEKKKPENVQNSAEESFEEEPFEPIHYDLDELLKGLTPDQMQGEISTGPAVDREIF